MEFVQAIVPLSHPYSPAYKILGVPNAGARRANLQRTLDLQDSTAPFPEKRQTCKHGETVCAGTGECYDPSSGYVCCANGWICDPGYFCIDMPYDAVGCCENNRTREQCGFSSTSYEPAKATGATSSTVSQNGSTLTYEQTAASDSTTLSSDAKAGIGVGVAIGVLILMALIALFFRRRNNQGQRLVDKSTVYLDGKAELSVTDRPRGSVDTTNEIATNREVFETSGEDVPRYELDCGWYGHEAGHRSLCAGEKCSDPHCHNSSGAVT